MTDREMLELAAQAAGVKLLFDPHGTPRDCTGADPAANVFAMPVWDPKNDNETALRLAAHHTAGGQMKSAQLLIDLQRQVAWIERLTKIESLSLSPSRVRTALVHHAVEQAIAMAGDLLVALKHEAYGKREGAAMIPLKIKRLHPDAIIPRYATAGAACLDLHSIDADTVEPGMACEFRTGLAVELPASHVMLAYSRSGNGFKYGVRLANCTGIIDSDYRGEIIVKLRNDGAMPLVVNRGARIAQALILPAPKVQIVEADELTSTERGAGGFGATGDEG